MQKLATKRGGKCLSKKYINAITKLKWQCKNRHQWEASPNAIQSGTWCSKCGRLQAADKLKNGIEQMHELAAKRGGKCLSKVYINLVTKLKWQCANGHTWTAVPASIQNHWCRKCHYAVAKYNRRTNIEQMRELAAKRGGKCLSKFYINAHANLRWQCKDGHQWEATYNNIHKGSWCNACGLLYVNENICREIFKRIFKKSFPKKRPTWLINNEKNSMELDGYNKNLAIAFEYHGKQHFHHVDFFHGIGIEKLNKRISDDLIKRILCKEKGVKLIEIPFNIQIPKLYDYIINRCKKINIQIPRHKKVNVQKLKLTYHLENLREMQDLAVSRGGKCLSKTYINSINKLKWQCKNKHRWEATPGSVKSGVWCLECGYIKRADKLRDTIERMQELAVQHGGICLSKIYFNNNIKLKWQCAKGHQWEAIPHAITSGHWCKMCSAKSAAKKAWITRRSKLTK